MIQIRKSWAQTMITISPPPYGYEVLELEWVFNTFSFLLPRGAWDGGHLMDAISEYCSHPKAIMAIGVLEKHHRQDEELEFKTQTITNGPFCNLRKQRNPDPTGES